MGSEFDQYVDDYKDIINRNAAMAGGSFEFFVRLRLGLMADELRRAGVPPLRALLDFGCGIGDTTVMMRERFPEASIDGVDSSGESIKHAKNLGVRAATFHYWESGKLPFADAAFDAIYSNGTFHHIEHAEHPAILGELARVLRPGGHLFVFENNPLNPVTLYLMRSSPLDRGTKVLFPWYLRRLQRNAGLRVQGVRFYVFFPRQLKLLCAAEKHLRQVPFGAQYYVWGTKESRPRSEGESRRHP